MSIIQLNEAIPVVTPLGDGYAIILEVGVHDNYWTVALNDNCAIVTFRQDQLRICKSYTHGRNVSNEEMKDILK